MIIFDVMSKIDPSYSRVLTPPLEKRGGRKGSKKIMEGRMATESEG